MGTFLSWKHMNWGGTEVSQKLQYVSHFVVTFVTLLLSAAAAAWPAAVPTQYSGGVTDK